MSNSKWLIALLCAMLCSQHFCAQSIQNRALSIDEMFRLADENSKSIKSFSSSLDAAREGVKVAKSNRLPDINVSASASYIGNGYLTNREFGEGTSIDMPHFGNNFSLEVQQIIYSGGALSGGIELAKLGEQMAELDWQKNRQEIRFMLVGYYLDLYKLSNQKKALLKNLELSEQVIKNMEARRNEGTALRNDITRYELQRENLKLQLTRVEDASKIINHQLVTCLHLPEQTIIVPDTILAQSKVERLAQNDWQELASRNNINLQQSKIAIKMNEQKLRIEKAERMPKVALVAEEHLDGPILIEVPVINKNFNYWFVGVGVKYSLSSLFKSNKKVKKAQFDLQESIERNDLAQEQVENMIQANYTNFLTAYTELRTQEKSTELADQNYAVTNNRYKNDLALLTDMLDASNTKLSADLNLVNARINVVFNYYKMKYASHSL